MQSYDELLNKIPEEWYEIKDCWKIACKMVSFQKERNDLPLDLNAYFFYKENPINNSLGFEGIYRKSISVAEDSAVSLEVQQEYDFLNQFLGFDCYGRTCSGKEAYQFAYNGMDRGEGCVLWLDTYYTEWNGMYQQIHFPHCVTVMEMELDKCVVFDAFRREEPFIEIDTESLFNLVTYVNFFKLVESFHGPQTMDEMLDIFLNNFLIKYNSIPEYINRLGIFYNDLIASKYEIDSNEINENAIKLTMRMFVNQYQKTTAQLNCFGMATNVSEEVIQVCEEIKNSWKKCANIFAKICYLPIEKRKIKYELLCDQIMSIREKLLLFDRIISRKELVS